MSSPAKAEDPATAVAGDGPRATRVYILASRIGRTLYVGVTNNLMRRIYEHRTDAVPCFTWKCQVHRLVPYEQFPDIENTIGRPLSLA